MEIIDISLEISRDMICYPGNPQPKIEKYKERPEDSTTESEICIGSHTGTHVDAPQHVKENAKTVKELDLQNFIGEAHVLDLTHCSENVDAEDLKKKDINKDIVLLKTENSIKGYEEFREDFTYLTLEGVEYLIEKGVSTVCIDYLSLVNFEDSSSADEAHRKANEEISVIEGVDLSGVESGEYVFSGTPLKISSDGAPMRAILIDK
jgi:arylformamidase